MKKAIAILGLAILTIIGCADPETTEIPKSDYDGSKFILNSEPEGGQDVKMARQSVEDADEVVVVGRIGGSVDPWVDGRAAFSIVDLSLLACSDDKEDGEPCSCKTPWDYCCETDKLPDAMALVKFVESDGSTVKHDARAIFDVKELVTVVVQGKAERDDAGNLTIHATGMFVRN